MRLEQPAILPWSSVTRRRRPVSHAAVRRAVAAFEYSAVLRQMPEWRYGGRFGNVFSLSLSPQNIVPNFGRLQGTRRAAGAGAGRRRGTRLGPSLVSRRVARRVGLPSDQNTSVCHIFSHSLLPPAKGPAELDSAGSVTGESDQAPSEALRQVHVEQWDHWARSRNPRILGTGWARSVLRGKLQHDGP